MPSKTRIREHPGRQIPEQRESQARDCAGNAKASAPSTSHPNAPIATTDREASEAPTNVATPYLEGDNGDGIPETDRALVKAMAFFEAPEAQPHLPYDQMMYTAPDEAYTFQLFPFLPVIPTSAVDVWRAVQLDLTHDSALGAALVTLAADELAFAKVIRHADQPGHYAVTLKLPSKFRGSGTLEVTNIVDGRVPANDAGNILGWAGQEACLALWPWVVAKAVGKLVRVLRTTGHLPPAGVGPALTYAQFCTWLTGHTPQSVTTPRKALAALHEQGRSALALLTPTSSDGVNLPGGAAEPALGGMAQRLRSHSGQIDVLLLNDRHYGVVSAEPGKSVTLYNSLGFNPHPRLATEHDSRFFDPHSLVANDKASATMTVPLAWLEAIGCLWFL